MGKKQFVDLSVSAQSHCMYSVGERVEVIKALYLRDAIPWVLGYSGGKDSTAVLQLVWQALGQLTPEQLHKEVHVICTDTLVDNPLVAHWITHSLEAMRASAQRQGLPIRPHRLTPALKDRFWVNLIGRGYPAPRAQFRWCTTRLKLNPSSDFIQSVVAQHGEAIIVLGTHTRDASSATRATGLDQGSREWLNRHGRDNRSWVYTPIADWTSDDVWAYLMEEKNPWGCDNSALLAIYQGTSADRANAVRTDPNTPACGSRHFGCYVCTLTPHEQAFDAMVHHNSDKAWMRPLLDFRKRFMSQCGQDDQKHREWRRANADSMGMATAHNEVGERVSESAAGKRSAVVYGPYQRAFREHLLRELLQAQRAMQVMMPGDQQRNLLEAGELEEIRRIWVLEKHEVEDSVPRIYEEVMGAPYVTEESAPVPEDQRR